MSSTMVRCARGCCNNCFAEGSVFVSTEVMRAWNDTTRKKKIKCESIHETTALVNRAMTCGGELSGTYCFCSGGTTEMTRAMYTAVCLSIPTADDVATRLRGAGSWELGSWRQSLLVGIPPAFMDREPGSRPLRTTQSRRLNPIGMKLQTSDALNPSSG